MVPVLRNTARTLLGALGASIFLSASLGAQGIDSRKGPSSGGDSPLTYDAVFNPSSFDVALSAGDTLTLTLDIENTHDDVLEDLTWELALEFDGETGPAPLLPGSNLQQAYVASDGRVHPVGEAPAASYETESWTLPLRDGERTGNVLLLADGGSQTDVQGVLDELGGYSVTVVADDALYNGDNPSLDGFDLVIYLDGIAYGSDMPLSGQQEIVDFVGNGGGLIVTEWVGYEVADGRLQTLAPILPMARTGGGTATRTYTVDSPSHPVTAGVASSFTVAQGYSIMDLNFGQSLVSMVDIGPAVAVSEEHGGRVLQFSHAANYSGYAPFLEGNMRQLLANGIDWASRGGDWMEASPLSGTVTAGTTATIELFVDTSNLIAGDYTATLLVSSNLLDDVQIPFHLSLDGEPDIVALPPVLEFPETFVTQSEARELELRNGGTDTLTVSSILPELSHFSVDGDQFTILPGQSVLVTVFYSPTDAGDHSSLLQVFSDDPDLPVLNVSLNAAAVYTPVMELSPAFFDFAAETGSSDNGVLLLDNSLGGSELVYQVQVLPPVEETRAQPATEPSPQAVYNARRHVDVAKGAEDPRAGDARATRDSGGPDEFGYVYIDSDEPGGPEFLWQDISELGDPIFLYGDDEDETIFLPFEFPFYGEPFEAIEISTNGFLTFGDDAESNSPDPFPTPDEPNGVIAPFWTDQISYDSEIFIWYDEDNGTFTIQWDQIEDYDESGDYTYQAVLHENGDIFFYYLTLNGETDDVGIGIEDPNGFDGLEVDFYNDYAEEGKAVRISPNSLFDWLSLDSYSGEVPAGQSLGLNVFADALPTLPEGVYEANIQVESNALDNDFQMIPVNFTVTGVPMIELGDESLDFGEVFVEQAASLYLWVENVGTSELTISPSLGGSDFSVDTTPFALAPFSGQLLEVQFSTSITGSYDDVLTLTHNDLPDNPSLVLLSAEAIDPPAGEVSPLSFDVTLSAGAQQTEDLNINNLLGGSELVYDSEIVDLEQSMARGRPIGFHADNQTQVSRPRPQLPSGAEDTVGPLADLGDIVNYWDDFVYGTMSIAFAGDEFWVMIEGYGGGEEFGGGGSGTYGMLLRVSEEGDIEYGFELNDYDYPQSMCYDGENFWVVDWSGLVTGYDEGGNIIGDFWVPNWDYYETCMTFDGQHFWFLDDSGNDFQVVGYDGSLVASIPNQGENYLDPEACTWVPGHFGGELWIYDGDNERILQTNPEVDGLQILREQETGYIGWIRAMAHNGDNLFLANYGGELWEIDDDVDEIDFFSLDPSEASVPAGQSHAAQLTFASPTSFAGTMTATLMLYTNDPQLGDLAIPLVLNVNGRPVIATDEMAMDFGERYIGSTLLEGVTIANQGSEELVISNVVAGLADYTPDLTMATLAPGETVDLGVEFSPQASGDRSTVLSIISNDPMQPILDLVLTGSGLAAPELGLDPESFTEWLASGSEEDYTLTLSNSGDGVLDYTLSLLNGSRSLESGTRVVDPGLELAKGEADPRPGYAPGRDSGGPDGFGYTWRDSNEPGGPIFDWVEIADGTGTNLFLNGDDNYANVELPFAFPFYGVDKTFVKVSTNGYLGFDFDGTDYSNDPIPSSIAPNDFIAPFWDDLNGSNGDFYTWHDTDNNRFVITWDQVWHLNGSGDNTFQAILYPSGRMLFQYLDMNGTLESCTIGLEDASGTDGLPVVYNAPYVQDGLAISLGNAPNWLAVMPGGGSIEPGESEEITVSVDATSLLDGAYDALIQVGSNDPLNPAPLVPFHLTIAGFPEIEVGVAELDFGTVYTNTDNLLTLPVQNLGTGHLTLSALDIDDPRFTTESAPIVIAPGTTYPLEVVFHPDALGGFSGTLGITSDDDDEGLIQVALLGESQDPPVMVVQPAAIEDSLVSGESAEHWLTVGNETGGSFLEYTIEFDDNTGPLTLLSSRSGKQGPARSSREAREAWASFSAYQGVVEAGGVDSILVTLQSTLDYAGSYSGTITVLSNDPFNPEAVLPLTLEVQGIPVLAANTDTLDFGSVFQNYSDSRSLTISNTGSALLTVTTATIADASFEVAPDNFSLQPQQSVELEITFSPTDAAIHDSELVLTSNSHEAPVTQIVLLAESEPVPVMAVYPDSLSSDLESAESETQTLTVDNTAGGSDLVYNIDVISDLVRARNAANARPRPYDPRVDDMPGKDERDTRQGLGALRNSGGPDAYGYSWKDSDEPNGVVYDWTDIRSQGTQLNLGGDDSQTQVTLPFPFPFYGSQYSTVLASTNGYISFGNNATSYGNQFLPSANQPNAVVAAFWDDLHFRSSGRAHTLYDVAQERFILQYSDVQRYSGTGSYTFQIILYRSGRIVTQYASMSGVLTSATVGIENADGTVGLTAAFNQTYVQNGLAVQFASSPDWITVLPSGGVVPMGETREVEVTFDAVGLLDFDDTAALQVSGNDPLNPVETIPVSLHVTGNYDLLPGVVSNPFPANGELEVVTSPVLSWLPADGAEYYNVYLWHEDSPVPDFPTVTVSDISWQANGLLFGETYNWKVDAGNLYGQSEGPIWNFTIRTQPDLEVVDIQVPNQVFTEQEYEVSWTITNNGPGATTVPAWNDRLYYSEFQEFAWATVNYLGQFSNASYLGAGDSYLNTGTFTVPQGLTGDFYVHVITDYNNHVSEGDESNNMGVSTTSMEFVLTPPPDLIVSDVDAPGSGFSGQDFLVSWTVENQGSGDVAGGSWWDAVYVAPDSVTDAGQATYIGRVQHSAPFVSGGSYDASGSFTVPLNLFGDLHFIVVTDYLNNVFEHAWESNNSNFSGTSNVTLQPPADLEITAFTSPDTASIRESLPLSWTIENAGFAPTETGSWYDRIYLSSDTVLDEDDTHLGGNYWHSGVLQPGEEYTRNTTVNLPDNLEGPWFLLLSTDHGNHVFEHIFEANNRQSNMLEVLRPDLDPLELLISGPAMSGEPLLLEWTVFNNGPGAVIGGAEWWTDAIYLTDSEVLDLDGQSPIGIFNSNPMLPAGGSYSNSQSVLLPEGAQGTWYLHLLTDATDHVAETDEDNNSELNVSTVEILLSAWANLQPNTISILNMESLAAGGPIEILYDADNTGAGEIDSTETWTDRFYLSLYPDFEVGPNYQVGSINNSGMLESGGGYTHYETFSIPNLAADQYYLHLVCDANSAIYEHTQEDDNLLTSIPLTIQGVQPHDMVVSEFDAPATGGSGQPISVSWTSTNQGAGNSPYYMSETIVISEDDVLSLAEDTVIHELTHYGLVAPGVSYSYERAPTLPNGLSGDYWLFAVSNRYNNGPESDFSNNTAQRLITISLTPPPDLAISAFNASAGATSGQPLQVSWTTLNQGAGATQGLFYENIYLSSNSSWDNGDLLLAGTNSGGTLEVDSTLMREVSVNIPVYLAGNYYLILRTDSNNRQYESDENNNTFSQLLTITQPDPSDLVVDAIAAPDSVITGEPLSLSWTLVNQGINPAQGYMCDAVYFSTDAVWDINDAQVGLDCRVIDISPGGRVEFSAEVDVSQSIRTNEQGETSDQLPGLTPGDYYVIVRTDLLNNINESDVDNNTGVSLGTVHVDMPTLALGFAEPLILNDGDFYHYRVNVPLGETLRITVSGEEGSLYSELYTSGGQVPSRSSYDEVGAEPYRLNQVALVPETTSEDYFVMVYGTGSGSEEIEILAELVEFSITSVEPDYGGRGGQVTMLIEGARFNEDSSVALTDGMGHDAELIQQEVLDASHIRATFELPADMPLGAYDLVVSNPERVDTILPAGFTVQEPTGASVSFGYTRPGSMRRNGSGLYQFSVVNTANNDIPFLSAMLAIPEGTSYTLDSDRLHSNSFFMPDSLADLMEISDHFDEQGWRIIPLVATNVAVGEVLDLHLRVSGVQGDSFPLKFFVDGYTRDEFVQGQLAYAELLRQAVLEDESDLFPPEFYDLAEFPDDFSAMILDVYVDLGLLDQSDVDGVTSAMVSAAIQTVLELPAEVQNLLNRDLTTCETVLNWLELLGRLGIIAVGIITGALLAPVTLGASAVLAVLSGLGLGMNIGAILTNNPGLLAKIFCDDTPVVASRDPNDILGPVGYGDENFVARSQKMDFMIRFENDPELATAPAQVVTIEQVFDEDADLSSFRLGDFGFGPFNFDVPSNRSFFQSRLDVTDSLGIYVDFTAGLDVVENRAFWILSSIDPATGEAPADPFAGFLAVNDSTGAGEGFVTYSIYPEDDALTGDVIESEARIVFDDNEPIDTPLIFHTIDAFGGTSMVTSAPAVSDSVAFSIAWEGEDDEGGSGVASWDVYRSINDNNNFELYQVELRDTSTVFVGSFGNTYHFFSIARDNVGNTEPLKTTAEASVQVISGNLPLALELPDSLYFNEDGMLSEDFSAYAGGGFEENYALSVDAPAELIVNISGLMVDFSAQPDWNGDAEVTFTLSDDDSRETVMASTIVSVIPVNDAPMIASSLDSLWIPEDGSDCSIDLDDVFTDVDGDPLSYTFDGNTMLDVEITDGVVCITPVADWSGSETLVFTADDGQARTSLSAFDGRDSARRVLNVASRAKGRLEADHGKRSRNGALRDTADEDLVVIVVPENDAPLIDIPEDFSFDEDGELVVDFSSFIEDIDSATLTLSASGQNNVTVSIVDHEVTFGAAPDWNGSEQVVFSVDDGVRTVSSDTTLVTVNAVNDAPMVSGLPDTLFIAEDSGLSSVNLSQYFSDVDGDDLSYMVEGASILQTEIDGDMLEITPLADLFGTDDLVITADDGATLASVTILRQDGGKASRRAALELAGDGRAQKRDRALKGNPLVARSGEREHTPLLDTAAGTLVVVVAPVNDPPELDLPVSFSFNEDESLTVDFLSYITDMDSGSVTLYGNSGSNVTVDIIGTMVTFSAAPDWNGSEELSFTVEDDYGQTAMGMTNVIVLPVNDAPAVVAGLDTLMILSGGFDNTIDLSTIFEDVDGDPLSYSVSGQTMLDVDISPEGLVMIEAPNGFVGEELLLFTADDGQMLASIGKGGMSLRHAVAGKGREAADDRDTASEDLLVIVYEDGTTNADERPLAFELKQNFPNPFNPGTTIRFTLPETGSVSLAVYDLQGRKVAQLLDGLLDRGEHELYYQATHLPSGVYIYRLESERNRAHRKMVLVK